MLSWLAISCPFWIWVKIVVIVWLAHIFLIFFMITWSKVTVEPNETIDVLMEGALAVPAWTDEKRFKVGGIEGF